jgi:regulator of protease activity HflC (stomatin/prohibitin superfamily)
VVNFKPQSVITEDNVVVGIETVLYFTVTEARSATYEIANALQAIEQLTVTTLRNVIGGLTLEATLTARENVNTELRTVLDEATGKWGIRINRVEIKSVDPPSDIKTAMEKQMRAARDRRAAILTAEGGEASADPDRTRGRSNQPSYVRPRSAGSPSWPGRHIRALCAMSSPLQRPNRIPAPVVIRVDRCGRLLPMRLA